MKAETAISELLMKCDEKGGQLPEVRGIACILFTRFALMLLTGAVCIKDSWQALREVIAALRNTQHHALGYLQIPKALEQLKSNFGEDGGAEAAAVAPSPRMVRRQKRTLMQDMPKSKRRNVIVESDSSDGSSSGQSGLINAMSPMASSKKKKYAKKSRIQEEVEASPATRDGNQSLVDQLVQLGEYEMHHGHSQRGLSRMRAAKVIRNSKMVITSGAQAKQLEHVGTAVATKIDQLLNEGLAAALSEYEGDDEALPVTK